MSDTQKESIPISFDELSTSEVVDITNNLRLLSKSDGWKVLRNIMDQQMLASIRELCVKSESIDEAVKSEFIKGSINRLSIDMDLPSILIEQLELELTTRNLKGDEDDD